jgi:PAS domain S-box-containing protein
MPDLNKKSKTHVPENKKGDHLVSILPDSYMEIILDSLTEHVIYADTSMRILWANRAACVSMGKTRDELIGKYCYKIWLQCNSPCPNCPVMAAIKTGNAHKKHITTPDKRTWLIKGAPLKDESGKIIGGLEVTLETTEKIQVEDSLKESEEKYRLLFEKANEGIINMDMKGKILDVNTKFSKITGFSPGNLIGKGPVELAQLFQVNVKQVASKFSGFLRGQLKRSVWTITTKDNRKIDITVHPSLIKKGNKKIGISVLIIDITQQKEAELALKENERFLKNVFDGIQDGISVLDCDLTILRTNIWMERMYKKQMPLIGKKCYRVYQDRENICSWCPSVKARETGRVHTDIVPYPSDKKPKGWMELSAFPLKNKKGKVTGIIEHVKDITDKKRAEEALKVSEEKYRNLIEQSNDAIYLLFNNKFEMINKRFTEMFGYTLKETNATDFNFRKLLSPKSLSIIEERVERLSRGEILESVYEFTAVSKSGKEIECETSVTYIDYKNGKATQGIIRDISDRKRSEKQIKRSLKEKEVLLKEIHHRVKNNLQIISSLLSLQSTQLDDKKALEAFTESRNRVHSMALVHERLYMSKDFTRVDFRGYVESIINSLIKTYNISHNINLDLDIPEIFLGIDTAIPCGLILNEMISNSLKHAFPQGEKGHIKISLTQQNSNSVQLFYSDDGVGISSHIDIDKADTLGLKLIHILTEQINGTLELKQNKGTTFVIKIAGHH